MNTLQKAQLLTDSGSYDSCGPKSCEVKVDKGLGGIYHAKAEHKTCRIFKTLMENSCSFDCKYCVNSKLSCNKKKASYRPEEVASLFTYLKKKVNVDGLFLSSAISNDPDKVTEKMLEAVRIIRKEHSYEEFLGEERFDRQKSLLPEGVPLTAHSALSTREKTLKKLLQQKIAPLKPPPKRNPPAKSNEANEARVRAKTDTRGAYDCGLDTFLDVVHRDKTPGRISFRGLHRP